MLRISHGSVKQIVSNGKSQDTERKIPLIPITENIHKIISASPEKYATIFTILEETGLEGQELATTLAEAITMETVCMSTMTNTFQLPNNVVYLGSAITFPQNQKQARRAAQQLSLSVFPLLTNTFTVSVCECLCVWVCG
jgi:hypothetical protein